MFADEDIAFNRLEVCNYRHLQGMAKIMGLPSNVKKIHLIEMIRAKKYCTETDLKALVDRVKMERKVNAQAKKKQKKKPFRLQGTEVSSTSNSQSPPISLTPKRSSDFRLQYSPDLTVMKYQQRPNIIRPGTSILQPLKKCNESDRVLRSFNTLKRPNYRIMEQNNCVIGIKAPNPMQEMRRERIQEIRQDRAIQSVNVTVQKHQPIMNTLVMNRDRQLVPMSRSTNTGPKPVKRKLSGIYPLQPREKSFCDYVPSVGFRQTDGRVTKINAVIQKPQCNAIMPKNSRPIVVTVQDVINYKVERQRAIETGSSRLYHEVDYRPNRIEYQPHRIDYQPNRIDYQPREIEYETSEINYQPNKIIYQPNTIDYQPNKIVYQPNTIVNRSKEEMRQFETTLKPRYIAETIDSETQSKNMDPIQSRKVYKGRQPLMNKVVKSKAWQYNIDYQEHTARKEWDICDINDKSIETGEQIKSKTYSHTVKEITEPNTKCTRITEPISRDYEMEYQKFNQEMKDRHCQTKSSNSKYPNMQALSESFPNEEYSQDSGESPNFSVYYHKKIRADQLNEARSLKGKECERLPRINDAFSQFSDVRYKNLTKPLYVQVSKESERVLPMLMQVNNINSTCMLESIYNFKNQFVTNPPVMMIATTQTNCTFSTKTVSTAIAQPSAETCNNTNLYERASSSHRYEDFVPRLYMKPESRLHTNFACDEVLSSSTNSLETMNSQELGANVTIPDMVEDALELISQDGDYMERIGMDVRVQCIICDWAGPKIILEYHIKKEHPFEIQQQNNKEWSILLTLGELISKHTWSSQITQHNDSLYVISSRYRDTDTIMVSLSIISTELEAPKRGRITVYNKISGKPYTFESEIKHLPDSMPYEYGLECLTLDVVDLDLIPNSANLRLVNRELVGSPSKVIVGQPELNNVEIVVYIKLLD